jgi:hypothetical protein
VADPTFTRTPGQPFFFLPTSDTPSGYTIAFLPHANPAADALTLSATWTSNPGLYLFLGTPIADQPAFVTELGHFIGGRSVRFLWITNPNDAVSAWRTHQIDLDPITLTVTPTAHIGFRNFTLSIGMGCTVALNGSHDALVATTTPDATIRWLTDHGANAIEAGSTVSIAFGAAPGTLQFTLAVTDTELAALDSGCRYFFADTTIPIPGLVTTVRYPIVTVGGTAITLHAGVDPINPLTPTRTILAFLPHSSSSGTALVSAFRSILGETLTLTPVTSPLWPNGPGLVLAVRPGRERPSDADPYYMTFEGPFSVALKTSPAASARMMCGYSGVEYTGLPAEQTSQVAFVSGQPAYAPVLRQGPMVGTRVANETPLTPVATTAWCLLSTSGSSALQYFAQPNDSVFYQAAPTTAATPEPFLYYLEVVAGTFPAAARDGAVPLVPYGLIDPASGDRAEALETQVLAPYRRNLLTSILAPTEDGQTSGERGATTPQGLLVTFSENLAHWKRLTLARANGGTETLQLASITGGFKSALQSNQLFAVVSNWQEFTRCCSVVPPFRISVAGWTFDLSPSGWAAHQTMLIVKYAKGLSIDELTTDSSTWAWPAAANGYSDTSGNLATTQADLRNFIDRAKADRAKRPDLQPFVDAVTNPDWNGMLFLRAPLSSTNFPDQLRGIAAGIDPSRLMAHHVGVSVAPVHAVNQVLTQEDASIFGLIDYDDPTELADTAVDYAFKVLGLTVLFKNSGMASFSSRVELLVNRLFGAATAQRTVDARGNNIVLDGFYQSAGGTPAYVFMTARTSTYAVLGSALESIDITRAQFVTLSPTDNTRTVVDTRFVFEGRLRFAKLSDFDVFSFGPLLAPDGAVIEDGSLFFANLLVEMSFPKASPAQTSFRFNAGTVAFDLSRSVARRDSLFAHFPLHLTGLLQAPAKTTPRDNGLTAVSSPLPNGELTDPWFALTFDLVLGAAGSLAGALDIKVQLGAAWSSGDAEPRTFVGMRLPGAGGSKAAMMLQGVVGLTYKAIEFLVNPSAEGIEYLLRFRGIALRLLTLTFPPGQMDLSIFGDPSGGESGVIGWYAAYAAKDDKKSELAIVARNRGALRALHDAVLAADARQTGRIGNGSEPR